MRARDRARECAGSGEELVRSRDVPRVEGDRVDRVDCLDAVDLATVALEGEPLGLPSWARVKVLDGDAALDRAQGVAWRRPNGVSKRRACVSRRRIAWRASERGRVSDLRRLGSS